MKLPYDRLVYAIHRPRIMITTRLAENVSLKISNQNETMFSGEINSETYVTYAVPFSTIIHNTDKMVVNKGIRISASHPVSVVSVLHDTYHDFEAVSAHLVLPKIAMKVNEYEYLVVTYLYNSDLAHFVVVGTEDGTKVTMTAPFELKFSHTNLQYPDNITVKVSSGYAYVVNLNALQVFQYFGQGDLTGIRIVSNKPLVVTSGNRCHRFEHSPVHYCSPILVQIPPVLTWGKAFLLVPFGGQRQGQSYKMVASQPGTNVDLTCKVWHTSRLYHHKWKLGHKGAARFFNTEHLAYCSAYSNKPLLITQSAHIQDQYGTSMFLVPAIEQYSSSFVFRTASKYPSDRDNDVHCISVIVTNQSSSSQLLFDDKRIPLSVNWTRIVNKAGSTVGYGCWFHISEGVHTLELKSGLRAVSAIVYSCRGSKSSSYGYPVGMNFPPGKLSSEHQQNCPTYSLLCDVIGPVR